MQLFVEGRTVQTILDGIAHDCYVQEAIHSEPQVQQLLEQAAHERCVTEAEADTRFSLGYKPRICDVVGWFSPHRELRTSQHYNAVYSAIYALLSCGTIQEDEETPQ